MRSLSGNCDTFPVNITIAVCGRSGIWDPGCDVPQKGPKKGFPKVGSGVGSGWDPGPKSGIRVQKAGSTSKIPTSPPMKKRDPVEPSNSFIILKEGNKETRTKIHINVLRISRILRRACFRFHAETAKNETKAPLAPV